MPFPLTTREDLDRHLRELGLTTGQDLVVHSRLVSFGRIEGGVEAVYEALRRALGPSATIAVPTYTLEESADRAYDPLTSPSVGMGVLSEHVRGLPGAVRSRCPLHSHAAVGPRASLLAAVAGDVSLGAGSDFAALRRAGFSLLLLGCGFSEGATFIHHLEAVAGVPYRQWQELQRRVMLDGTERRFGVRYYARVPGPWTEDFDRARAAMQARGLLRAVACPLGISYLASLSDIEDVVTAMLRADPYALVSAAAGAAHG